MPKEVFYKYRSLENWKFVLDIIVNNRLHAAPFQSLNDPMEGRYYYFGDTVAQGFRKAIYNSKQRRNICSLSQERANTLLWSYYAAGHTGVAFGVQVPTTGDKHNVEVRDVRYDSGVYIGQEVVRRNPDAVALDILTQKQLPWQHKKEVRVFTAISFLPVKLTELVLGCNISPTDQELITAVARRWHPRIRVTKLNRSSLDRPEAV
jgi:hypothetical protein